MITSAMTHEDVLSDVGVFVAGGLSMSVDVEGAFPSVDATAFGCAEAN